MIEVKDFVKIRCSGDKIAKVIEVHEHTAFVKMFDQPNHRFYSQLETIALNMIEPANLTPEELRQMPCGKRIVSRNGALQLLATNTHFKEVKRRENRVYYCARCSGYHTTSKPWIPINILKQLNAHPILEQPIYVKDNIICSKIIFRWFRDILGLKISSSWFLNSLKEFSESSRKSLEIIINNPESYLEFYFEKRFIKTHSLEIAV